MKKSEYIHSELININCQTSSQFVSGLLIALNSKCKIDVGSNPVSFEFINLSINVLKHFGKSIIIHKENSDKIILEIESIKNDFEFEDYTIQPDATSATYPIIFAILNKQNIFIPDLNKESYQGDIKYCISVMQKFGCKIEEVGKGLYVYGKNTNVLNGIGQIDFDSSDTFLSFAILASFSEGITEIMNINNQEQKECKRISTIYDVLKKCNIDITLTENNSLIINGKNNSDKLSENVYVYSMNDHRIAMSTSLLASKIKNVTIDNYQCVNKTYPTYWEDISEMGLNIEI